MSIRERSSWNGSNAALGQYRQTIRKDKHCPASPCRIPLIAKPDIGERGTQVALVNSSADIKGYCRNSRVDFLIQEFIPFEKEVGIFYVRIPGEAKGRITGIVGKELLSVTGDGKSTIRTLLQKDPRSLLQLDTLASKHGDFLDTILPPGAGTSAAFFLYGFAGGYLIHLLGTRQPLLNWGIGIILLITALAQLYKTFIKPSPGRNLFSENTK